MDFQSFLESLDIIWPIIYSILGAMVYKIIPYFQTKIQEYRYYNIDSVFILIEYELMGSVIIAFVATFLTVIFGQSTWEYVFAYEYGIALLACITIYVIGIIIIVMFKLKGGVKSFILNILLSVLLYLFLLTPLYIGVFNLKNSTIDLICTLCICLLSFLQIVVNVKTERVKNVEYKVLTSDADYFLVYKPIKYGKYFYLRIHDENKKEIKRVQIPEDKIVRIEYIIHEISKNDEEKLQDPLIGDVELENGTENCEIVKIESNDGIEKER